MSYRLDQGNGVCIYRLGVEDDGCHSLMDYANVAESARILECIARSLNAVVVERKMIQNEITESTPGTIVAVETNSTDLDQPIEVLEPSVWSRMQKSGAGEHKQQNEEEDDKRIRKQGPGNFTRADITIHRVETHLLDAKPISLLEMAVSEKAMHESPTPVVSPDQKHHQQKQTAKSQPEHLSVGETLSARNIRIAVVGNVDAGE